MSKNISSALKAHLQSGVTTIATCWKLTRQDGVVMGFTSHDKPITYNGVTYEQASGFTPSAIDESVGLKVDNLEIESILDSNNISEEDIEAGLYDYARIEIFIVNYEDLSQGHMILKKGILGALKVGRNSFYTEVRGLSQLYTNTITESFCETCRAELGDARCKVDLNAITVTGSIIASTNDREFTTDVTTYADGYFDYGLLVFTSGANATYAMEVKQYQQAGGAFKLFLKLPKPIAPGDTFTVYPGCDKKLTTCEQKFNNVVNFRGEPYIPGKDRLITGK